MVLGIRVGGVCEMCMRLVRRGVRNEGGGWIRGLGLGFTKPVGTGSVGYMSVFGLR